MGGAGGAAPSIRLRVPSIPTNRFWNSSFGSFICVYRSWVYSEAMSRIRTLSSREMSSARRSSGGRVPSITGPGSPQEEEEVIGAVLVEKKVVGEDALELPRVKDHPPDLFFGEVEAVLPQVPLVHIGVFLHLLVIREDRKISRVKPEDPLEGVDQSVVPPIDRGGVIDRIREKGAAVGGIDAQERVTEHRR